MTSIVRRYRAPNYSSKEESDKASKAYRKNYMLTKEWYCEACNGYNYNYMLSNKSKHLRTKKHYVNSLKLRVESND